MCQGWAPCPCLPRSGLVVSLTHVAYHSTPLDKTYPASARGGSTTTPSNIQGMPTSGLLLAARPPLGRPLAKRAALRLSQPPAVPAASATSLAPLNTWRRRTLLPHAPGRPVRSSRGQRQAPLTVAAVPAQAHQFNGDGGEELRLVVALRRILVAVRGGSGQPLLRLRAPGAVQGWRLNSPPALINLAHGSCMWPIN